MHSLPVKVVRSIRYCIQCLCKCLVLMILLLVVTPIVKANSVRHYQVFYAGVSYLGNFSDIENHYPHAINLNKREFASPSLDEAFYNALLRFEPAHFELKTGLANLRRSQSLVLSLAIEQERISEEIIGDKRKLIFEVGAQVLLMDFKQMRLVANFPLEAAINHVIPVSESPENVASQWFSRLYFGVDSSMGLVERAAKLVQNLSPVASQKLRFQVSEVKLSDKALSFLPKRVSETRMSQFLGQYFTARLSETYGLPVLPFTRGYAIGNKMAGRFANGDIYTLEVPPPDYDFAIEVMDFRKSPYDNNQLYATRLGVVFQHSASNKRYIDGKYHYAVPKLISKNHAKIDDWAAYEDAIEVLMSELIGQLSAPNSAWHKQHSSTKTSYRDFRQKKELFGES